MSATPFERALTLATSLTSSAQRLPQHHQRGTLRRLHGATDLRDDPATRLERSAFQFAMYQGAQLPFIEAHPDESPSDFASRPHLRTLNLTRVCVDVLSGLYRSDVERQVEHASTPLARELAKAQASLDGVMLWADRLTRLQGVSAIQPFWDGSKLGYRVIPAHRLAAIPSADDPSRAEALLVLSADPLSDPKTGKGASSFIDIWTAQEWHRVIAGEVVASRPHNYGTIPFAIVRDRLTSDGFFVEGRGLSLAYDNAVLNARLSDLAQVVAMQGFGVMEVVNPDPAASLTLSPGRALAFRASGDMPFGVSFKNPNAPIQELLEEIRESIQHILLSQRIPERAIAISLSNNASGLSIHASQTPLAEDRQERTRLFRDTEHELYALSCRVVAGHLGLNAESAGALRVNFPEQAASFTREEQRADDAWRLAQGLVTPWEIMLRDDADAYRDLSAAKAAFQAKQRELSEIESTQAIPTQERP